MKKLFGKRGSYTVFLAMFMSGMLIMSGAVISKSHRRAIDSSVEDLGRVWASSIIGEYDRVLKDRYGLMGYYGNEEIVRKKLASYSEYTFKSKRYIKTAGLICDLKSHRLADPEIFRQQLCDIALTMKSPVGISEDSGEADAGGGSESDDHINKKQNRFINADWIIQSLPSRKNREEAVSADVGKSVLETAYIFRFFKDYVDKRDLGETFFSNEIEYIITGKLNDEKARKSVYNKLMLERNGLNMTYLYSCAPKRQLALEAAALITPGPEAVITQALILETWALLEARNDIELLYDGERVPLVKGDENWALSLDSVVDYLFSDDRELDTGERKKYIKPGRIEGQRYEDYLKTLLMTVSEKKKLLRIMDLIQINMKYLYCDYFLLDEYFIGVDYEIEVNGKKHEFSVKYGMQ